jgi:hypothetical protein
LLSAQPTPNLLAGLGRNHLLINHTDKTIPYRLSPAELEDLRILRKRMKSSASIQDGAEDEQASDESDASISVPERVNQNTEKKIPYSRGQPLDEQ